MVLLDLQKAFDTLCVLLKKLQLMGFNKTSLEWFRSYLSNRPQVVAIHDIRSKLMPTTCGVPHGSILGTILFTSYINDMCICMKDFIHVCRAPHWKCSRASVGFLVQADSILICYSCILLFVGSLANKNQSINRSIHAYQTVPDSYKKTYDVGKNKTSQPALGCIPYLHLNL